MKKSAIIIALFAVLCLGCKRMENTDENQEEVKTSESELPNTRTDVNEIEGDTMPVEVGTGMDTTHVPGAEVGTAADR